MKKHPIAFALLLITLYSLFAGRGAVVRARDLPYAASPGYAPGQTELLVRMQDGIDPQQAREYLAERGLVVIQHLAEIGVWRVAQPAQLAPGLPRALQADPAVVDWVEQNGEVHAAAWTPNDEYFSALQGHLVEMGFPDAWSYTQGTGVTIAILDSGVDLDHPDLVNQIWSSPLELPGNAIDDDGNGFVDDWQGWDFINNDADAQDDYNHGSHVAGIAAASTNNGIGIAGVAGGAKILPVKVLDSSGKGNWAGVAAGIIYAANQNARVINLSLGGKDYSQTLADAVAYAVQRGCLIVAAAGNNQGQPTPVFYPAALDDVLAVAATGPGNLPWAFSNYGPQVDLAAPGVNILSADKQGSYYRTSGTSMAAPHVSGLAALIWSLQPELSAQQVRERLTATATDAYTAGWDDRTGWGVIDAKASVLAGLSRPYHYYLPLVFPPVEVFEFSDN